VHSSAASTTGLCDDISSSVAASRMLLRSCRCCCYEPLNQLPETSLKDVVTVMYCRCAPTSQTMTADLVKNQPLTEGYVIVAVKNRNAVAAGSQLFTS
jgi:hypothetical protein